MEPVGHLCDIPPRRGNGCGIVCRSIAADDLHLNMLIQPCLKAFYIPITEKVYDRPGFKADDNTAVCDAFAKEHRFKEQNMTSAERYVARLKPGSTADLMRSIEDRLADYALSDDAGCGELLKKAMRYARAECPAMKRVLESGDVEVSNNISEQSV